jgi:hypothetical protein
MFYASEHLIQVAETGKTDQTEKWAEELSGSGTFYSKLACHYMEIKQVVCLKTQNLGVYSTGCARNLH